MRPNQYARSPFSVLLQSAFPFAAGDFGTLARNRDEFEIIHQAPRPGQAHAHAFRGGVAILHHQRNIINPRPLILAHHLQTLADALLHFANGDEAFTSI